MCAKNKQREGGISLQVFDPHLFDYFPGYSEVTVKKATGKSVVQTPNVIKYVQDQFACADILGAEIEDDGGRGTAGAHWDERLFEVCVQRLQSRSPSQ